MLEPLRSDATLLADVDGVRRRATALDLWWLGQSGFLMQHRERWIVIDPYLSDTLTEKYAATTKPHVRISRRVVDPGALVQAIGGITLVTSSHSHTDHLDPGTLRPLLSNGLVGEMICPKSQSQLAYERSGAATLTGRSPRFTGLDDGESSGEGIKVTAVAAAHDKIDRDERGHCKYLGYVFELTPTFFNGSGSMFKLSREWTVYHSGDTVVYPGMVDRLKPFGIDVAILPINGKVGNMNGTDAARLAKDIGARVVIPCHYDMFEFNTADPYAEFVPECERIGQRYRVLQLGERWSSDELDHG